MVYRNKFIVGLNGVDNTGKSTLVNLINQHLRELDEAIVYMPPHFSRLSRHFPKEESQVVSWLKNAPNEEIVRGILDGCIQRNELIERSMMPYVLIDRGFFSIIACCTARLKQSNQREDLRRMVSIADEMEFTNIGEMPFLLESSLGDVEFIQLIQARSNECFEQSYIDYLISFRRNLLDFYPEQGVKLNVSKHPKTLVSEILNSLKKTTDIKYREAFHLFLTELRGTPNIRTIFLTGSLSTNSIQLGWSDIDLLCITSKESDITKQKIQEVAEEIKRSYNIDVTPWVVAREGLGRAIREEGKIRYTLFEKSESRCVYGVNDYSGLVDQELVSSLTLPNVVSLYRAGVKRLNQFKRGEISLPRLYIKNLKMCFNIVKSALLGEGTFCPTYQETYLRAKELYPNMDFGYLQDLILQKKEFMGITEMGVIQEVEKQIKFSYQFLEYLQPKRKSI